jgi:hypothetical protein
MIPLDNATSLKVDIPGGHLDIVNSGMHTATRTKSEGRGFTHNSELGNPCTAKIFFFPFETGCVNPTDERRIMHNNSIKVCLLWKRMEERGRSDALLEGNSIQF